MLDTEIIDVWNGLQDLALEALTLYMTVVTGYIVAAFLAGRRLLPYQAIFVSVLFIVFALFAVWGSVGYFFLASEVTEAIQSLPFNEARPFGLRPHYIIGFLELLGILGSLKFMWDIRRSKIE